ncbi:MAG: 16S rRNA processing protein RimM [Deltaproteobacteria bacterium]|nr:16S rRNA processing protein RimM [Deltaproteobacteria bacterium]
MSRVSPENLLLVGKVIRPHGLGGLLRIYSYAQSGDTFLRAGNVFLKIDPEEFQEHRVVSIKKHGNNVFLIGLEGLNSLEDVERFRGAEIFVRKDGVIREDEEEYFWFELIGLKAYLENGRYIGVLSDILNTGSNDIYVVKEGKKEILIPALHDVIKKIDLESGKIMIDVMEDLLDLNEV